MKIPHCVVLRSTVFKHKQFGFTKRLWKYRPKEGKKGRLPNVKRALLCINGDIACLKVVILGLR